MGCNQSFSNYKNIHPYKDPICYKRIKPRIEMYELRKTINTYHSLSLQENRKKKQYQCKHCKRLFATKEARDSDHFWCFTPKEMRELIKYTSLEE